MSETLHNKGLALAKEGKYAEAINLYNQALESGYKTPDLLNDRAIAYFHTGDKLSAFNDFTESKNLQPDYSYRYACLAFIKEAMGDTDGAIEDYEHAIKLDPSDAVSHNNLGLLQEKKGYAKQAKTNFDKADKLEKELSHFKNATEKIANEQTVEIKQETVVEAKPELKQSFGQTLKLIFTDKNVRKDFLLFLKKGFKH